MREEIARYVCVCDDRTLFTVIVYQVYADVSAAQSPSGRLPIRKGAQLLDGGSVTLIDDETFKIVATGQVIRRVVTLDPTGSRSA